MSVLSSLYKHSLALLTDLYQLTMAYSYWKAGKQDQEAAFHLTFRHNPFQGGFSVACGLSHVIDYLKQFRFSADDLTYLESLTGSDGKALFEGAFLEYLGKLRFECEVDAMPEGTLVFPHEPLIRVIGPIIQCQILETPLLNLINFQSLIATKAVRVCLATQGEPVLEFGLRRAQGIDGGLAASRAAYIGGCAATSNLLAGKLFDIPVKGTHAHSWVMSFDDELEAFKEYARAMPNNCVFLVDTYDSLNGVRNAIEAGKWLKENGFKMLGIRLDSGDLGYLSIEARKILDEAGFTDAAIIASNNLDEKSIASLKSQGAKIGVWGVGTRLATSYDQPAFGGVYKLTAVRYPGEPWQYRVKLSEQMIKSTTPGVLQVRRFFNENEFLSDMVFNIEEEPEGDYTINDFQDITRMTNFPRESTFTDLLIPVFRKGQAVYETPPITEIRRYLADQLNHLHPSVKLFDNFHQYPVGIEKGLQELKTRLVMKARSKSNQ